MTTPAADAVYAVLLVLCIGLPTVDVVWRWWRVAHPARRSPSRRDWARVRAAEQRAADARTVAGRSRVRADAELRARRAAVRRRLDVVAAQCRQAAFKNAGRPVDPPPPGWTRVLTGTLT
ncbi:hypothetical protein [Actinoalloteichus sp. GBA129-24]|uniref:hypothetical protein n=1 Tax=Actinoalloteichus sp. GBA129-24 TaxID=1612551 RepID=UPI0012FBB653|nr:hypothetical protein [Actinoalloteichus sp. GBA129-24]